MANGLKSLEIVLALLRQNLSKSFRLQEGEHRPLPSYETGVQTSNNQYLGHKQIVAFLANFFSDAGSNSSDPGSL